MYDLISRKALISRFERYQSDCEEENDIIAAQVFADCICELQDAPAVDAAPVVHGRWDDSGRFKFFDCDIAVRCSMCGGCLTEKEYAESVWNFCPVCGSKMDGGNDND